MKWLSRRTQKSTRGLTRTQRFRLGGLQRPHSKLWESVSALNPRKQPAQKIKPTHSPMREIEFKELKVWKAQNIQWPCPKVTKSHELGQERWEMIQSNHPQFRITAPFSTSEPFTNPLHNSILSLDWGEKKVWQKVAIHSETELVCTLNSKSIHVFLITSSRCKLELWCRWECRDSFHSSTFSHPTSR